MPRALTEIERVRWLQLSRTPNVGPVTFAQLLARFGSAEKALAEVPRLARRGGGAPPKPPDAAVIEDEIAALEKWGGKFIASCEPDFPKGLAGLDAPPPVISVLGHPHLLRREAVAIVGARNASALGRKLAQTLARDLGDAGLTVVSGMARGIDTAAHEGALESGTVAVVAGGVDIIYPPENKLLYARLIAEGAVISEMPLSEAPQARHFPRRNRIVSGMARGVVVVEAAEGSGSLITARMALEQNREVFAVPGSPLDPRAKGANRLIRDGATLTESAADVLAVLAPILGSGFDEPGRQAPSSGASLSEAEIDRVRGAVEEALGPAPVSIDELIRLTDAPAQAVLAILLELELAGKLTRHPGNAVSWGVNSG
ncbi:DNA processing protein [Rhizomicrobium palustre]|uniref:DNA processing protein n=1 Tax=Rhizomicrobium palustre TaxID=189966 RepID=A0A846N5U2_9PROT|nr:DNA-processing protein DprA [Rhizomicrobium palustre]NIK90360.1 DNA processing protein [Rhizomicrobium palustre]